MGTWIDFLHHMDKKGEEIKTLELFAGCKESFRSSGESTETTQNSIWEKKTYRSKECEKKSNKMEHDSVYWIWKVSASILKHISSVFKYVHLRRGWRFFLQAALLKNWK